MKPNFKVELLGRPTYQPIIETQRSSSSISKFLSSLVPHLAPDSATMLVAGVGSGKTTWTLHTVIDLCLQDSSISVCFVSSRCAINAQIKRKLASQFGQDDITKRYTPLGLQL